MSKNVKIGNNTFNGVTTIKLENADNLGTYCNYVDTTDADALASEIVKDKTAYVGNYKITGQRTGKEEQTKTVALSISSSSQTINPDTNKVLTQVTIEKPATLVAENIKYGIDIGGVTGTFETGIDYYGYGETLYIIKDRTYQQFRGTYKYTLTNQIQNGISLIGYKLFTPNGIITITSETTHPICAAMYVMDGDASTFRFPAFGVLNGILQYGSVGVDGTFTTETVAKPIGGTIHRCATLLNYSTTIQLASFTRTSFSGYGSVLRVNGTTPHYLFNTQGTKSRTSDSISGSSGYLNLSSSSFQKRTPIVIV